MGFLEIKGFTDSRRQKITSTVLFSYLICIFNSVALIVEGLYIEFVVVKRVSLVVHDSLNDLLPWVIVSVGFLNLIVNVIGAYICVQTYHVDQRTDTIRRFIIPYLGVALFVAFYLFAIGIMAIGHVKTQALHSDSLTGTMRHYSDKGNVKKAIDKLQIDFECCGSENYHDWFKTSWTSMDRIDQYTRTVQPVGNRKIGSLYHHDDVPFSCCSPDAIRPCIHHSVLNDSKHFNYRHNERTTLYVRGCFQVLMEYNAKVLWDFIFNIMLIIIVQLVNIIIMRFLQTSVYEAIDRGHPEFDAPGWLFGSWAKGSKDESNVLNHNDNAEKLLLLIKRKKSRKDKAYSYDSHCVIYPVFICIFLAFVAFLVMV